jgi:hypothetical protein
MDASPSTRHPATFQKSTTTTPMMSSSPPRRDLPRTNSMPVDPYSRPVPGVSRAQTFSSYGESPNSNRGRSRSKLQPQHIDDQIVEEPDSDSEYEREQQRRRERKARASKKARSPEPSHHSRGAENVSRYAVNDGRSKLSSSYLRHLDEGYYHHPDERPIPSARGVSYSTSPNGPSGPSFPKVKTSRTYSYDDVQYSNTYNPPMYRDEYPAAYA